MSKNAVLIVLDYGWKNWRQKLNSLTIRIKNLEFDFKNFYTRICNWSKSFYNS